MTRVERRGGRRRALVLWAAMAATAGCQSKASPSGHGTARAVVTAASSTPPASPSQLAPLPSAAPDPVRPYLWFAAKSKRAPLIVFLHGYGSNPAQSVEALSLDRVAKAVDVHIAVPEGTPDKNGLRFWHADGACCDFDRLGIDDVAALTAVLADVAARHDVSEQYLIGFSNGAFMAHRMACDAAELIDGFVAFAGVGPLDQARCRAAQPLHMLQIHGTADRAVRYGGGKVLGRPDVDTHPSAPDTMRFWAERGRCTGKREVAPPHPISDKPTSSVVHVGCAQRRRVGMWTVTGGGHLVGIDRKTFEAAVAFMLGKTS